MPQFIEYIYPDLKDYFGGTTRGEIQLIENFNILTVHIPRNVVYFNLINAKDIKQAHRIKEHKKQLYVFAKENEIYTTQQIRDYGPEHTLRTEALLEDLRSTSPQKDKPENDNIADTPVKTGRMIEEVDDMMAKFVSPHSFGQTMMDFIANRLESMGCHRLTGTPPSHCAGISDRATVIDRNTRRILALPLA